MYLLASNGNLFILFIYVSVGIEYICQPLILFIYVSVRVECICQPLMELVYTVCICFSGSRMYLPASNGNLCILFIYVTVKVECICQPLIGTCVYCLYLFQWE